MRFRLTLLTDDPTWAAAGALADVNYIGVDVERAGKADRQTSIADARINTHDLSALPALGKVAPTATLWARLNPLHPASAAEVKTALAMGATVLTQPQFTTGAEVEEFRGIVDGRAKIIPLLEDIKALDDLDAILRASGDGEIMVGMNDLSRSMGLKHPLQLCRSAVLDEIGAAANAAKIRWGFGGVADPVPRPDLPVQPDDLLSLYAAMGATGAWISRSMVSACTPAQLPKKVAALRNRIEYWRRASADDLDAAKARLKAQIDLLQEDL